jgi:lactoylglutathione lyase
MKQIKQFDHLNMTVADLDKSLDWYQRVFGFEGVESGKSEYGRWAIIKSGEAMLCLYERENRSYESAYGDVPHHGINHFAIRITDSDEWREVVERENVEIQFGEEIRYPNSTSWYVVDPTGYQIEVVHWDEDKIRFAA